MIRVTGEDRFQILGKYLLAPLASSELNKGARFFKGRSTNWVNDSIRLIANNQLKYNLLILFR